MGAPQIIVVGAEGGQYGNANRGQSRRSRRRTSKKKEEEKKKKDGKGHKWSMLEVFLVLTFLSPIVGEGWKMLNLGMVIATNQMNLHTMQMLKGMLP